MVRSSGGTTVTRPGLIDPLDPALHLLLRRAVLDHITSEHRRVHPAVLHAGLPGVPGHNVAFTLDGGRLDHALCTDAVEAMLRRVRPPGTVEVVSGWRLPLVWLTRRGALEALQDIDVAWLSATRTAAAELGREVPMVVVTREGWRDPLTGTTRTWRRLRPTRS